MGSNFNKVKESSGEERDFGTGGVRDMGAGKGRYDLLPLLALFRLARHFENGARRYQDRNWEKGLPLSVYWDSACRHLFKTLLGLEDEDHASAALWNVACYMETKMRIELGILPKKLDDMPDTFKNPEVAAKLVKMFEDAVNAYLPTKTQETDDEILNDEVCDHMSLELNGWTFADAGDSVREKKEHVVKAVAKRPRPKKQWFTMAEAASRCNVSVRTLHRWVKLGKVYSELTSDGRRMVNIL